MVKGENHRGNRPGQNCGPPRLVGVITSPASLVRAARLRRPPDFFELRLDALRNSLGKVDRAIPQLRAPLILTARHPAEGGYGSLGTADRRTLLARWLKHAALVDLELRSIQKLSTLLEKMRRHGVGLLLSVHELRKNISPNELIRLTKLATEWQPVFFKLVIRTDTRDQLDRLIHFCQDASAAPFPIAAMGIGKMGRQSRLELVSLGSSLVYGSIGNPTAEGQPTLTQLRRDLGAYIYNRREQ